MADIGLDERSALSGLAVPGRYGARRGWPAGITVSERRGLAMAHVIARKSQIPALAEALTAHTGVAPLNSPRRVAGSDVAIIGVAPAQWLVVAEATRAQGFTSGLTRALDGLAAVSDQSHARAVLRIGGPRAFDVLAKGCALDLHPRTFAPGDVATTQIALIGCQLWQLDETPTCDIAVPSSFAHSFWRWLVSSAAEFGYEIRPAS